MHFFDAFQKAQSILARQTIVRITIDGISNFRIEKRVFRALGAQLFAPRQNEKLAQSATPIFSLALFDRTG